MQQLYLSDQEDYTPFQTTINPHSRSTGMASMRVGDKVKLTIPPELGYDARGAGGVTLARPTRLDL